MIEKRPVDVREDDDVFEMVDVFGIVRTIGMTVMVGSFRKTPKSTEWA